MNKVLTDIKTIGTFPVPEHVGESPYTLSFSSPDRSLGKTEDGGRVVSYPFIFLEISHLLHNLVIQCLETEPKGELILEGTAPGGRKRIFTFYNVEPSSKKGVFRLLKKEREGKKTIGHFIDVDTD